MLCSNYRERRLSVKYTTYILHTTATCFGYLSVTIIRLYTGMQKGNYLPKQTQALILHNFIFKF